MCEPGNRSIYRTCKDALLKETGRKGMPNQEMRRLLRLRGGCMNYNGSPYQRLVLDKELATVQG